MKKRIAIAVSLVLLAAVAAAGVLGALWYREQTEEKSLRGSPTEEFIPSEPPPPPPPPPQPQPQAEEPPKPKPVPWLTFGYDVQRTKFAPELEHRPPFRMLWNVQTDKYIEFPPAVADGRVFVANQKGAFLGIRGKDGKVLWRKDFGRCIASGPTVSGDLVYLSVQNPLPCHRSSNRAAQRGFVIAVDAKTGKTRWRFDTAVVESSPLIVGKNVYVGAWNHRIYALNKRNGRVRWAFNAGEEINSSGAFWEGTVYFGGDGGHLFALNAWTGALEWKAASYARFGRREYFYSTPVVAYGRVYIGNTDGTLYSFGAKSGRLIWAQPAGTYVYASPAVWNERVYIGTYDGKFSAFDAATGDLVWRTEAPGAVHGAPTVMNGLVYFATLPRNIAPRAQRYVKRGERGAYALDARTGKLVWQWPGMGTYSPVVADENRVYLVGSTRVVGLEPENVRVRDKEAQRDRRSKPRAGKVVNLNLLRSIVGSGAS